MHHDWSGNPEAPVPVDSVGSHTLFGHPSDPKTTSPLSAISHNASASKINFKGAVSNRFSACPTRKVIADVVVLDVQAVARRLRASRVGLEARRTMASQSEPYDAVVIGGGVFALLYSGAGADTGYGSVGPGGYVAAIKAAQLGLRVSMVPSCPRRFSYYFFFSM